MKCLVISGAERCAFDADSHPSYHWFAPGHVVPVKPAHPVFYGDAVFVSPGHVGVLRRVRKYIAEMNLADFIEARQALASMRDIVRTASVGYLLTPKHAAQLHEVRGFLGRLKCNVASTRGRPSIASGRISNPLTRVDAASQVGRQPMSAKAWARSSPPVRIVAEPHRSSTIRFGQSP